MTQRAILLQALTSTPADIRRLLKPLPETAAKWRPAAGFWSPIDIMLDLIHVEIVTQKQINLVLIEDSPAITPIDPGEAGHDPVKSLAELASQFEIARGTTLEKLTALQPGAWQRAGHHETKGRITLRALVNQMVDHDIESSNRLVEVVQAWRKESRAGV